MLARVARGIERLPVALVLSGRPEPRRAELNQLLRVLAAVDVTWVNLGPLDEPSTVELLENLLDSRPGSRLGESGPSRPGGNPLFVCELVGALLADHAIVVGDGNVPSWRRTQDKTSLSLTILHQLSFLPPEVLDLLGLASVLGATFGITIWRCSPEGRCPSCSRCCGWRGGRECSASGGAAPFRHELSATPSMTTCRLRCDEACTANWPGRWRTPVSRSSVASSILYAPRRRVTSAPSSRSRRRP